MQAGSRPATGMVKEFNWDGVTVATAMLGEISSRRCYEMKRVPLGVIFPSCTAALSCRRPSDQEPQYHLARYYPSFYLRIGEGDELLCCLIDTAVVLRNLGGNTASYKIPRETSYASFYPPQPKSLSTRATKLYLYHIQGDKNYRWNTTWGKVKHVFLYINILIIRCATKQTAEYFWRHFCSLGCVKSWNNFALPKTIFLTFFYWQSLFKYEGQFHNWQINFTLQDSVCLAFKN